MSSEKVYPCPNSCGFVAKSMEELDKHTIIEKINEGQPISISNAASVFFKDMRILFPALDANPDECLLLTVSLPGIRTVEGKKKGEIKQQGDMIMMTITDRGDWFETTQDAFLNRGWLAHIPALAPEQRWSSKSLQTFLFGKKEERARVDPCSVFRQIRSKFEYYIDFQERKENYTVCALYVLMTYFYFLFEYVPYLKLGGEKGSGKTKTGNIFAALAFNGQIFANASAASIYRMAQDTRGTMVIDEAEDMTSKNSKNEERIAYSQIILSGWERNGTAIRVDKDSLRPTRWATFCPKVICSIGGLMETLEDRAFEIVILKSLRNEISEREVSLSSDEWKEIRDSLYLLLMDKWKEIKELYSKKIKNELSLPGRIWNIAKPLLCMAKFVDSYCGGTEAQSDLGQFLMYQTENKKSVAIETNTAEILQAIEDVLKDQYQLNLSDSSLKRYPYRITVKEVMQKFIEIEGQGAETWVKPKYITRILRNLGLYKDVKFVHGRKSFVISGLEIEETKRRLNLGDVGGQSDSGEQKVESANFDTVSFRSPVSLTSTKSPAEGENSQSAPGKSTISPGFPNSSKEKSDSSEVLSPYFPPEGYEAKEYEDGHVTWICTLCGTPVCGGGNRKMALEHMKLVHSKTVRK